MAVGSVNGISNQSFSNLINQPQAYNVNQMQAPQYSQGDSYGSQKSNTGRNILLGALAGVIIAVGGARIAKSKDALKIAVGEEDKFVSKFIKKPASEMDDWTMKQWDTVKSWFDKSAKKTEKSKS